MITSRVSSAVRLYGLSGMPCSPGGSTGAGRGSCVTCTRGMFTRKSLLQDILYVICQGLSTYSVSSSNAVVTERMLPGDLKCSRVEVHDS